MRTIILCLVISLGSFIAKGQSTKSNEQEIYKVTRVSSAYMDHNKLIQENKYATVSMVIINKTSVAIVSDGDTFYSDILHKENMSDLFGEKGVSKGVIITAKSRISGTIEVYIVRKSKIVIIDEMQLATIYSVEKSNVW